MNQFPLLSITTAQQIGVEPEAFQSALIESMSTALLRQPAPPCLLRAPTGSGKTLVLSRVLENVSAQVPTLWLWFVPFVTLVAQTEDALAANAPDLTPVLLSRGRNLDAQPGMVLLSTAQAVARAVDRKQGYDASEDDEERTIAAFVARARVQGLRIGLVVDEAHIGLDKTTEFGQFAHWLKADCLLMATATPKDERLLAFLGQAGLSAYESFAASRDEVVNARLNKRYIEAVVYDLRQSAQSVTDLKRTVLRQAWRRSQRLKRLLEEAGVPLTPLLLVQVANGEGTVEAAERDLIEVCKVHPAAIGKHSSDAPDPVLMAAIANDATKEVLIFKQSAGTGFDAPRAFVLASNKSVNDSDFAMQFVGRVMRVAREVRAAWRRPAPIPDELNTAYVYLADAEAQRGFDAAVQASQAVKSQLEGQTERLEARQMASGAVVFTNRPSPQAPLMYDTPLPTGEARPSENAVVPIAQPFTAQGALFGERGELAGGLSALGEADYALDVLSSTEKVAVRARPSMPKTHAELESLLSDKGIRLYPRRIDLKRLPSVLKRERRPEMLHMSKVSEAVATRLDISEELRRNAVRAARDLLKEKEVHTELTQGARSEQDVQVMTDRAALSREAQAVLRGLPQVEDADVLVIVQVLSRRLREAVNTAFEDVDEELRPDEAALNRYARDAAFWVIRREAAALAELMQGMIAEFTELEEAEPLPDGMLFPVALSLAGSRKNIYGVLPPSEADLAQIEQVLLLDDRGWLADRELSLDEGSLRLGCYDGLVKLNGEERAFAQALDRADFVEWWHRNPDRKPYAVKLVRGEHKNYFYPDFVVCLSHVPGDDPLMRLIETKENLKDAARKARRVPKGFGKVLFLTREQDRLRMVNDDGSLGAVVNMDDLLPVREWLRSTRPVEPLGVAGT